jgi:hypothetical protein
MREFQKHKVAVCISAAQLSLQTMWEYTVPSATAKQFYDHVNEMLLLIQDGVFDPDGTFGTEDIERVGLQ